MAVQIKEEANGIYRLGPLETGHDSGPTSPFLVVGKERAMIAEPGQDGQAPQIAQAVKERGLNLDQVAYVWASHIHYYHVQGLSPLLKLLPKAKFLVHPIGARHVIDVTRLTEQTRLIWTTETPEDVAKGIKKCYGQMLPVPADRVQAVEDGQVFDLGGRELQIVFAPGHASHHMGLFDRQTRTLWPGDLGYGAGTFGEAGGGSVTMFDVDKYLNSVRRYLTLKPSILLVFGLQQVMPAEETLNNNLFEMELDERIATEGMRQKLSIAEIDRRVNEGRKWINAMSFVPEQLRAREQGAPAHLFAFIKRKHPELEIPKDIASKVKPHEGVRMRRVAQR